jgi:hypothetical protein
MSIEQDKTAVVEKFWRKLEDQTARLLSEHAPEVHAVAEALLEQNDLTGRQCIEIIQNAAVSGAPTVDSERLLRDLVDQTMVTTHDRPEKKPRPKRKLNTNIS